MTQVTSISLTKQDKELIDEYALSPSAIVQEYVRKYAQGAAPLKKQIEEIQEDLKMRMGQVKRLWAFICEKKMELEYSQWLEKNGNNQLVEG